jgi:aspartate dehydrogenase
MALEFALIGYGAIARYVLKSLRRDEPARCTALIVRKARVAEAQKALGGGVNVVTSVPELGFHVPPLVVEAAGHGGLVEHGPAALEAGSDLVVVSVGALADRALYDRLASAAEKGKSKILIVAGAVGGIDALGAARQGGLARVRYVSRKPPKAWKGTPGEKVADLTKLATETVLYQGRADEAARLYPQNANVCATIALAGAGWEKTEVTLMADPAAEGNIHQLEAEGAFGKMSVEMRGKPLPDNPKTSSLAALSVLRAIRNRAGAIEI